GEPAARAGADLRRGDPAAGRRDARDGPPPPATAVRSALLGGLRPAAPAARHAAPGGGGAGTGPARADGGVRLAADAVHVGGPPLRLAGTALPQPAVPGLPRRPGHLRRLAAALPLPPR